MANTPRTAPAIRGRSAKPPEGRRFQPGQSGNPSGRPKGIAKAVRDHLNDPERLVTVLIDVAEGRVQGAKVSDRIMAVRELLDRGYGKAPTFATIEGHDPLELDEVSAQIQAIADELGIRRAQREAPPGVEGAPGQAAAAG